MVRRSEEKVPGNAERGGEFRLEEGCGVYSECGGGDSEERQRGGDEEENGGKGEVEETEAGRDGVGE